jgi:endo-1,4-beta-xylanase
MLIECLCFTLPCAQAYAVKIMLKFFRLLAVPFQKIASTARRLPRWAWPIFGVLLIVLGVAIIVRSRSEPKTVVDHTQTTQTEVTPNTELLQSDLVQLPGGTLKDDGLHIAPLNFAIVNQDGSGGQPNPPLNLYGGHLSVSGDFNIRANLKDTSDGASFNLYGQVPIIADEFRYDRNTLELTFTGNQINAQIWQGGQQTTSQVFTYTGVPGYLEITRHSDNLSISLNGHKLGNIEEHGLFASKEVWFGASATTKAWRLASLHADALGDSKIAVVNTASLRVLPQADTLNILAEKKRPGFMIGAAVALGPLVSDAGYAQTTLGGNFGILTTENALKWQFVHPAPDTYDFQESDAIVALAQKHNIKVHGHPLVFGEANPAWVRDLPSANDNDRQRIQQVMTDHISTVVGRYKGKIASWDVVNEPLADYPEFEKGTTYRQNIWFKGMSDGYIAKAFQAARAADPGAKLFINEFGLEDDGERWDFFILLLNRLKLAGTPIDGVGFQAHVYEAGDKINPATLKRHIEQLASMGLSSRISEMDVYSDDGTAVQAQQYSAVLSACLQEASCVSFTSWGVSDRYDMFREDSGSNPEFGEDFLWDKNMQPIPAVDSLRKLLR